MVMMHELAHNVQMNHGKAFWAERNRFASEMKALWNRGYTGEGFWGSGRSLESLQDHAGSMVDVGEGREVEGLCGGTFRSRGRKRKRVGTDGEGKLTWREQRDRRVERKFGKNGVALGEDGDARIKLEIGRRGPLGGKPRVAGSKRGRELRAAAALARFEVEKVEERLKDEEEDDGYGSGTEDAESGADESNGKGAVDVNGNRILDSMGFGMVRVCGDEDVDDVNVKKEMEEFETLESQLPRQQKPQPLTQEPDFSSKTIESPAHTTQIQRSNGPGTAQADRRREALYSVPQHQSSPTPPSTTTKLTTMASSPSSSSTAVKSTTCPICSTLSNPRQHITCPTCAHVLDKRKDSRAWKCNSQACKGSDYINGGDCGRCGGCGGAR
jgi:DNA-dependent metalloprotease WSS1